MPSDAHPDGPPEDPHPSRRASVRRRVSSWSRGEEPEFGRVAFFTDAVYAIAMTLLVLDLRLPPISGDENAPSIMWQALGELTPKLVSFAVAFILLGRYWLANHSFFTEIARLDRRYLTINMVYLASVAFLPFPTSLVGEYESNPVSGVLFALTLAAVSGLETVLLVHSHRARLMRSEMSREVFRWEVIGSVEPCVMFVITAPIAFIDPTLMLLSWVPIGFLASWIMRRRRPADLAEV